MAEKYVMATKGEVCLLMHGKECPGGHVCPVYGGDFPEVKGLRCVGIDHVNWMKFRIWVPESAVLQTN